MKSPLPLLAILAASAMPASAATKPNLDMRFKFEGRTFHYKAEVHENAGVDINRPVTAEDGQSRVLLSFHGSLGPADAYGRSTLSYKLELHGEDSVKLISSEGDIYVRPGTYSTVSQCGGWDFNLGYWTGSQSGLRTGNDRIYADVLPSGAPQQKQHCAQQVKPGGAAAISAEMIGADGKPQPISFQFLAADSPSNGAYPVTYNVDTPWLTAKGQSNLEMGRKGSRAAKASGQELWLTLAQDN